MTFERNPMREKEVKVGGAFADLNYEGVEEMFEFTSKLYKYAWKDPEIRKKIRRES